MKKPKSFKPKTHQSKRVFDGRKHITDLYDHAWEKYREKYLKNNPKCYACGKPSKAIDHVAAHRGDVALFWKLDNMIPLCTSCHNTVTSLFDRQGKRVEKKLEWLKNSRLKKGVTTKAKVTPRGRD